MKHTYFQNKGQGFTLIELLVVVAIIGIVTAIVVASLSPQKDQKDAENAALVVAAKIREAQSAALTGKQYTAGTTPCSYRVVWSSTNITSSYVYKDGSENCTQSSVISVIVLPGSATFSDSGSIDFAFPHGNIATAQVLTIQRNSASRVVCVSADGLVEVQTSASNC